MVEVVKALNLPSSVFNKAGTTAPRSTQHIFVVESVAEAHLEETVDSSNGS